MCTYMIQRLQQPSPLFLSIPIRPVSSHPISRSQPLPSPSLNRNQYHSHKGREDKSRRQVNRGRGAVAGGIGSEQRSQQAGDAIEEARDARGSPAHGSREYLGGKGVQDAVHDVLAEGLDRGEEELGRGRRA